MGLEVNIAVSCSIVVDGVVGHTLGFLILVLDIIFNPISCRKKKELMHQNLVLSSLLSILCLFVPSHSGDLVVLWLGKLFFCFILRGNYSVSQQLANKVF